MAGLKQRSILFLVAGTPSGANGNGEIRNDNHQRLPLAFRRAGWAVTVCPSDSLALDADGLSCAAGPLEQFERIWHLGFGTAATFFDRMQMLFNLPAERFVTSPVALLTLHGKFRWLEYMPETHVSNDPRHLLARTGQGGEWVLKPPAGSFGREVRHLVGQRLGSEQDEAKQAHNQALLAAATDGGRYAVLQRYLPEVTAGETRVLTAAGQLIGQYLRVPVASGADDRPPLANRAAGATTQVVSLNREQAFIASRVANDLLALGVGFAAIDLVGENLLEVNIANPGGLERLTELKGGGRADGDPAQRVVAALCDIWES
ncbi:MAG: hypothetical protein AAGG11_01205 [Pseudomonadota bacterium]